jgi:signal transduction histidine kinase
MERRWVDLSWSLALGVGAVLMIQTASANLGPLLMPVIFVASYLAGRRMTSLRMAVIAFALAAALSLGIAPIRSPSSPISASTVVLALEFAFAVLPWWLGRYRKLRADRMAHEGRIISNEARLRERARIAQDMHDSLGHELALIALRSGALELAPGVSDDQRKVAAELRASAVAATDRLHEIVGVLRDETQDAPRHPAGESIDDLVLRARRSGVDVVLRPRHQGSGGWPPMVAQAAHRVVLEGLTNAAKHAPGASVTVTIEESGGEVVVSVVNDRPASLGRHLPKGSGLGLTGLDERVRVIGGSLEAGPRAGGYAVIARLPRQGKVMSDHDWLDPDDVVTAEFDHGRSPTMITVAEARRLGRRRQFRTAILPLSLAIVLGAVLITVQAATVIMTALPPASYDQIRIGQTRAEISELLPSHSVSHPPPVLYVPPEPPGSGCELYQARSNIFDLSVDMYRLCFDEHVLVAKDHLTERN